MEQKPLLPAQRAVDGQAYPFSLSKSSPMGLMAPGSVRNMSISSSAVAKLRRETPNCREMRDVRKGASARATSR